MVVNHTSFAFAEQKFTVHNISEQSSIIFSQCSNETPPSRLESTQTEKSKQPWKGKTQTAQTLEQITKDTPNPAMWEAMKHLPLETLLITCYVALNILFCVVVIDWSQPISQSLHGLIGTTGTLAIVNLVPLVITAGRNNPLIQVLKVSFDKFNLVHRWLGRIVVAEAVAHTVAVLVRVGIWRGWDTIPEHLFHNPIFTYGFVATTAFVTIFLQSLSPFRHAFYEFFLHFHIVLVTASFVALWYHLHKFAQEWIFVAAIIAWATDRLLRLAIVAWRNCGKSLTSTTIQLLPGDVARVDVTVIRPWKFKAGQYMYLYIPALGLWTSHPFSAAWESTDNLHGSFSVTDSERSSNSSSRSILSSRQDERRTVSFLIRKRDGFTKKMLKSVGLEFGLERRVLALAEGPFEKDHLQWVQPWMTYILNHPVVQGSVAFPNALTTLGSRNPYSLDYGTYSERTLSLSINVHLTTYYSSNNTNVFNTDPLPATYSSLLCNQEKGNNPFNDEIAPVPTAHTKTFSRGSPSLSRPHPYPRPPLAGPSTFNAPSSSSTIYKTIDQYYYQHDDEKSRILTPSLTNIDTNTNTTTNQPFQDWTQLSTPTAPVTINLGKPLFRQVLEHEMAQQIGAIAVSVCGPGGMGDEVRKAVREVQGRKTVEFFEESFSW
ncbi:Riboflavin synthase-like beta-barrel [Penicillium occitanis (nom. inval.)]|nr:hypothetical protein PENOC_032320 [Penicillium occitanis (nom. inval.)]PCH09041.1 Riboflavin synthase-like beta-barrel [Penicillium occitanis (nom. inval.)]